jgi:DNA-binding CsgD family transcriptional regulator
MRGLKSKLDMVRAHVAALTPRERQVFELVIRGKTNKDVARTLGETERTIKAHRHRLMENMQVQSLAELVFLAERIGIASAAGQTPRPFLLSSATPENVLCEPHEVGLSVRKHRPMVACVVLTMRIGFSFLGLQDVSADRFRDVERSEPRFSGRR